MADSPASRDQSGAAEFLVASLPDPAAPGASMRLLRIVRTRKQAEEAVQNLDASTLGRVAILQRVALYHRRPTVESVPTREPLTDS